jgi:hypothetical protein
MANLFVMPKGKALNNSVLLVSEARLYFYETGTSNPKDCYADVFLNTPYANPVVSDAYGNFPPIWLDTRSTLYRVRLTDSQNFEHWTVDDVGGDASLPIDIQILTRYSIQGGGDLSVDRTLDLVGDVEEPGTNKVYGTDTLGDRGWKDDPIGLGSSDLQIFQVSGTWTKIPNAKLVEVVCISGGGGGGSGRKGLVNNNNLGGAGGGGGGLSHFIFDASTLGATESVVVGLAGIGGIPQASNDSYGLDGTSGGDSSFGEFLKATGGILGHGGNASGNTPGGPGGIGLTSSGGAGATSLNISGTQPDGEASNYGGGGGGCGGHALNNPDVGYGSAGGAGPIFYGATLVGGTGGTTPGQHGGDGNSTGNRCVPGSGGGGGTGTWTSNGTGGNGGIGGRGAGGGGGGFCPNGTGSSGVGGVGGDGVVVVMTYT